MSENIPVVTISLFCISVTVLPSVLPSSSSFKISGYYSTKICLLFLAGESIAWGFLLSTAVSRENIAKFSGIQKSFSYFNSITNTPILFNEVSISALMKADELLARQ